ncbi:MAG: hypothetical protein RLZ98_1254 [Pseudomonadota bacterium]|jgi:SpoVK/Ycf46/Vps4 family AAA+-type ATPase
MFGKFGGTARTAHELQKTAGSPDGDGPSPEDIERGLIARYLHRFFSRVELPLRAQRSILFWLNERSENMSLPLPSPIIDAIAEYYSQGYKSTPLEKALNAHRAALLKMLEDAALATPRPEPLAENVDRLITALEVTERTAASKIVGLIACSERYDQIQYLANAILEYAHPVTRTVAIMVGEPLRVVEDLLSASNELLGSGILQLHEGDSIAGYDGRYKIPSRISNCLDRPFADFAEMRNAMLGTPLTATVGPDDYEHVAVDRDLMIAVLKGGVAENAPGINILLYGPPGSGKTELAKVIAAEAGLAVYAAGEDANAESESDRSARLADLVFSERLLRGENSTALLFDEMEDVAIHLIRRGGSKVYLNRLLERNPVPIIWTSNELGFIDPALLRRMTLAIELKRAPAPQRKRIMDRLLSRIGVSIPDADVVRLAEQLDATPAIIENAIRAAKYSGGGSDTIERAARGIMRAVSGVSAPRTPSIPAFDPLLARANQDLIALADQLVSRKARDFSLCLYGPPGTGKSAFARYLAGRLGLEVLQKRASDILGPFVGQSERNIADSFEEAREAGAFLVFDEADSLLLDRRDAHRSWEITQVNEMLTWMEDHPLPVCFTTNLMDRIDQASLRRFTFNVRFEYLDRPGVKHAWRVFFGDDRATEDALALANLTPGDFAKARKQADVLGTLDDPARMAEILGEISRSKPGASGTLGFRPPGA